MSENEMNDLGPIEYQIIMSDGKRAAHNGTLYEYRGVQVVLELGDEFWYATDYVSGAGLNIAKTDRLASAKMATRQRIDGLTPEVLETSRKEVLKQFKLLEATQ